MLTWDGVTSFFPNNYVVLLASAFVNIDSDLRVFRRPLRANDGVQCVGVFAAQWDPDPESYEMQGAGQGRNEPTVQRYICTVQGFVQDMDEERGLAVHALLSRKIRSIVYGNEALRLGLQSLYADDYGSRERSARWYVERQRFLSSEVQGNFLYFSSLEINFETEIGRLP